MGAVPTKTKRQALGFFGESLVCEKVSCSYCDKNTLTLLPRNTPVVDLRCQNCQAEFQVKTLKVAESSRLPKKLIGAAWAPLKAKLDSGDFTDFYVVLVDRNNQITIWHLPKEIQRLEMFEPRRPLTEKAKSPGWQGYMVNLSETKAPLSIVWRGATMPYTDVPTNLRGYQ